MDDEFEFFTRRPLKKTRSKPKSHCILANGGSSTDPSSSAGPSALPASSLSEAPVSIGDEDDDDTMVSSSDGDVGSDDSDESARRRAKRRKKKHAKTLPAWASQAGYRAPSLDLPPPSSSATQWSDSRSAASTTLTEPKAAASTEATPRGARSRGESLTPPPPPSPEKLSMARDLVSKVIGSKFSQATTAPVVDVREGRRLRSSATPGAMPAGALVDEVEQPIHWDPDLARLMRGEDKRHLREQARKEQQERDERRRQRQRSTARTQPPASQSNGWVVEDGDSDASIEHVPRPTAASSPSKKKKAVDVPVVVLDSSDDESAAPAAANQEQEQETLSLTLQSKLGSLQVTVTPTTKLATVLAYFLSHHPQVNVPVERMSARFDGFGFKHSQTVGEMDVEDADQVEITWP